MDSQMIQWFLEQVNAKVRPVTDEQVTQLCRTPEGPILPDALIDTERVSMEDGEDCVDLEVDSEGVPYMILDRRGSDRFRVVCGEDTWTIVNPYEACAQRSGTVEEGIRDLRIIGFDARQLPLVRVRFTSGGDMVFRGDKPLWRVAADTRTRVVGVSADAFLYTQSCLGEEGLRLSVLDSCMRPKQDVLLPGWRRLFKAFVAPDGAFYLTGKTPGASNLTIARVSESGEVSSREYPFDFEEPFDVCEFVLYRGAVHLLISHGRYRERRNSLVHVDPWMPEQMLTSVTDVQELLGEHRYRRQFTQLDDGRCAYIGERTRHKLECWVVDGQEQPGFKRVSRLFRTTADRMQYYGLTESGRHCCLMALPEAAKK